MQITVCDLRAQACAGDRRSVETPDSRHHVRVRDPSELTFDGKFLVRTETIGAI
jgi:hypothetical protein